MEAGGSTTTRTVPCLAWSLAKTSRSFGSVLGSRLSKVLFPSGVSAVGGGRYVLERGVKTFFVVPGDPLEDRPLDLVEVPPRPLHLDQLGLEGAVQRLGHRVIVRVGHGADGGGGTDVGEPVGIPNWHVSGPAVAVMNEAGACLDPASPQSHLQRNQGSSVLMWFATCQSLFIDAEVLRDVAIGRPVMRTSQTARSRSSSGYLRCCHGAGGSPSQDRNPGIGDSTNLSTAQHPRLLRVVPGCL